VLAGSGTAKERNLAFLLKYRAYARERVKKQINCIIIAISLLIRSIVEWHKKI
jgi:hypothetical protein